MRIENFDIFPERNVSVTAYIQAAPDSVSLVNRPAILILPGGGYEFCSDREGEAVAGPFLQAGYQVFILHYSVQKYATWPHPLEDYEHAMELIRGNSEKWSIHKEKVAVIGFSAGGHLAACAATMAKNRPNAVLLGYALTKEQDIRAYNATMPDAVSAVTPDTPPCFLFSSVADHVVSVDNSLCFMHALAENHVAFECHIYAYGPHGFSTGDPAINYSRYRHCDRIPHWVEDGIGWLKDLFGSFTLDGYTQAQCKGTIDDDKLDHLSLDCTLQHILACQNARELVAVVVEKLKAFDAEAPEAKTSFSSIAAQLTLREITECLHYTENEKESMDAALQKIRVGV